MIDSADITPKQQEVLGEMPAKRNEIAEELNISRRAVRYRQNAIEEETDISFERDSDGKWSISQDSEDEEEQCNSEEKEDHSVAHTQPNRPYNETEPKRVDSYSRAQNTKDTHNQLTELEIEIKEALENIEPVVSEYSRTEGKSTLVIPHSDSHVGAIVEDRYDVDYYSAEEARGVINEYFDRCIQSAREREDVEDVVVIFNGDHLDGEGIFPAQRHEQEDGLRDQQRKAGRTYIEQLLKLSDEFENVWVYQVPGNHGRLDKESTTNADMMLYDFIEVAIDYSPVENVHIEKAGAGGFLNFTLRGWNYLCRHGESMLEHVGTSSGKDRAKNHYMQYDYDIFIRSHYHAVKYEVIGDNVPIVMTGSPAPQSTFAEKRSAGGGKSGVHWFTTEENVIEEYQPMDLKTEQFGE